MDGYDATTYGDLIAEVYDDWYSARMDPGPTVSFLATLAGPGGRALELGVGTGRVALPLAACGVTVVGIEASDAMVRRLRKKDGGDRIDVVAADFADVGADGRFALVYAAFTTFFALRSADDQRRCLRNVAGRLEPGGAFVLDAFVPDPARYDRGQRLAVEDVGAHHVMLEASRHDRNAQRVSAAHLVITEGGLRIYPVELRYAWPAELDAMAEQAGLALAERYHDYDRRPFTASSTHHVSVYRPCPR